MRGESPGLRGSKKSADFAAASSVITEPVAPEGAASSKDQVTRTIRDRGQPMREAQLGNQIAPQSVAGACYLSHVTCHFARGAGRASWHLIYFHNDVAAGAANAGGFSAVVAGSECH
jgi:hypothetical protein